MKRGDRVRLTGEGKQLFTDKRKQERHGTIVGMSRNGASLYVNWDGTNTRAAVLCSFVERARPKIFTAREGTGTDAGTSS